MNDIKHLCWQLAAAVIVAACSAAISIADEPPVDDWSAAINELPCDSLYAPPTIDDERRAGYPHELSRLARFENRCTYTGYYVGGGEKSNSNCRSIDDGTWGWDYFGRCYHRLVRLDFGHPSRYQGGEGQYQPDGPKCRE